ncbi:E12.5 [Baboon adenovirus 3]|uniref:E12.5 n=1 Tax=Simian mastadenovirus C TaxID=1962300 RepID=M9YY00_9ADEN|nr:E12.5 [Baboon adenovirus 3]AGK27145.1 E12.5 [Baboon adenovirus 3]AGK27217.1 E12.5 [Simian mastadenovirus C]
MTDGAAVTARLRHLHHCRRFRCFAREPLVFSYFELPEHHLQGPAHGIKLEVEKELESRLIRDFTPHPLLVEKEHGTTIITVFCICPTPGLHEGLCCRLCAEFNL